MRLSRKRQLALDIAIEVLSNLETTNIKHDAEWYFAVGVLRDFFKNSEIFDGLFDEEERRKIINKDLRHSGVTPISKEDWYNDD